MSRCKRIILTLALVSGMGLAVGCSKNEDASEKAAAEKSDTSQDEAKKADKEEASADEPPLEATGPVATVNGKEIPASEFNEAIELRAGMMPPGQAMTPQMAQRLKGNVVDGLVTMKLVEAAVEKSDVEIDSKDVDAEYDQFRERMPSEEDYKKFMEKRGLTEEKLRENFVTDLKLRKLMDEKFGTKVSDKDAKAFYKENESRFEHKAQVHARHILLKLDKDADEATVAKAKARAEELAKEAQKPDADFEALAKKNSEGPTASRGGDLGFFEKGRMVPAFADAAFAMKAGEISDPVKSEFGYHVIQVVEKKDAGKTSFDEVKEKILSQLERQKFNEAMRTYMAELKKDAKIEKHEDNIKINVEAPAGGAPAMGGGQNPMQQLPPELQKKLKEMQQKQQQQKGASPAGGDSKPADLKLKEPTLGK